MTTTRNRNEYSSPEIMDYREDEELRYRENFEAEPDGTYARQNDHLVKFEDEMRQVDEQAERPTSTGRSTPPNTARERKRDLVEAPGTRLQPDRVGERVGAVPGRRRRRRAAVRAALRQD